jgi:predicted transcriptional regulator
LDRPLPRRWHPDPHIGVFDLSCGSEHAAGGASARARRDIERWNSFHLAWLRGIVTIRVTNDVTVATLPRGLDHGKPSDDLDEFSNLTGKISATVILATIAFYGIWTAAVLVAAVISVSH